MAQPNKRGRTNLRLGSDVLAAIDRARELRPGTVSRNTWISEAIQEKLARENVANDREEELRESAHG